MRRNRRRGAFSKEKIVMAASTVLVLGTLTVTGLWLGAGNKSQDDGYVVDLSTIEQDMTTGVFRKGGHPVCRSCDAGCHDAECTDR